MFLHAPPAPKSSGLCYYVSEDNDTSWIGAITNNWSCGRLTRTTTGFEYRSGVFHPGQDLTTVFIPSARKDSIVACTRAGA